MESLEARIKESLEGHGFSEAVAGRDDFASVVRAVSLVLAHRKLGIYFTGVVGVGKSCAADAAARTITKLLQRRAHVFGSAFNAEQLARLVERAKTGMWDDFLIDDIAADGIRREYGNSIDPFAEFVMRWYDYNQTGPGGVSLLYVTTNEPAQKVEARYGSRVFDRIASVLAVCNMAGSTKRSVCGVKWRDGAPSNATVAHKALPPMDSSEMAMRDFADEGIGSVVRDAVELLGRRFSA